MAGKTVRVAIPDRPEVRVLLADCKEHPDDVGLRLILADWLEDHDDPRGTFLRLQCYSSDPDSSPSGNFSKCWEMEADALRQQHETLWLGRLRGRRYHAAILPYAVTSAFYRSDTVTARAANVRLVMGRI